MKKRFDPNRILLRVVEINALLLELDEHPKIELVPHEWMKSTFDFRAAVSDDFKTIYLNDDWIDHSPKEFSFKLSHEMRHVWQNRKMPDLIAGHKSLALGLNFEEYNQQPSEVDANAWAFIVVSKITPEGVPLNTMFGEKVAAMVEKRINEIYDEMQKQWLSVAFESVAVSISHVPRPSQ